jgi:hypothetical protein
MYPSIPITYGLNAVRTLINEHYNILPADVSVDFVIDLLEWVLTNNYFTFDDITYHQLQGTAMGTNIAPTYAQIVMSYLERAPLHNNPFMYYNRYMDDIIAMFRNKASALKFIEGYNNACPSIQLDPASITIELDHGIILDLELHVLPDGTLITSVYQKPLNSYLYIPFTSAHPIGQLKNWILEEIKRYRLYCTRNFDFYTIIILFRKRLVDRGYTNDFLNPIFTNLPHRSTLIKKRIHNHPSNRTNSTKGPILVTSLPTFYPPLTLRSLLAIPN